MTVKTSKQAAAMIMWTVHWNSLELNHYTPPLLLRIQRRKTSYGCNKSAAISFWTAVDVLKCGLFVLI